MRILRIADVPDDRTGGMSRAIYGTGDQLVAMGHKVDYLFSQHFHLNKSGWQRRLAAPLKVPALVHDLVQRGQQYDVVEIHEPLAAPYCFLYKIKKNLPPVVIFSHGLERRCRLAELSYNRQKGIPGSFSLRDGRLTVLQSMYSLKNCNHVICLNSEDIAYLKYNNIPEYQLTQSHNGVDPEFLVADEVIAQDSLSRSGILFLGSWIPRKGTMDLTSAMNQLMQQHPLLRFTIAGFAGAGCHSDTVLANFSDELHGRIKLIPKLSGNEELIDVYRQHSIFVLPSYFEGHPLVMLEAAAMGLAIVTTNICGMADFIDSGVNGFSIPVGDVNALIPDRGTKKAENIM